MVVGNGIGTPGGRKALQAGGSGVSGSGRKSTDGRRDEMRGKGVPAPPSLMAVQETRKREAAVRAAAKRDKGDLLRSRSRSPAEIPRVMAGLKRSATPQTHKRNSSVTPNAPSRTSSMRTTSKNSPRNRMLGAGLSPAPHARGPSASPTFLRQPAAVLAGLGSPSPGGGGGKEVAHLRQLLARVTEERDELRQLLEAQQLASSGGNGLLHHHHHQRSPSGGRRRAHSRGSGPSSSSSGVLEGIGKDMLNNFGIVFSDLTINRDSILGSGGFGTVYIGDYQATDVAVKVHRADQEWTEQELNVWRREVKIMTMLRHPNILMLLGAVFEKERLAIITEYCEAGTLQESLFTMAKQNAKISWGRKLKWMMQICKGMAFLHYKRVFHRDLKAANVFVTGDTMKIADFGLSKFGTNTKQQQPHEKGEANSHSNHNNHNVNHNSHHPHPNHGPGKRNKGRLSTATHGASLIQGTFAFMAPEVWAEMPYTDACDVYSFGVLMIELLALDIPFERDFEDDCSWRIMTYKSRPLVLRSVGGEPVPEPVREIIRMCIAKPAKRPMFTSLVAMLRHEADAPFASKSSAWPQPDTDPWVGVPCSEWPADEPDPLSDSSPYEDVPE